MIGLEVQHPNDRSKVLEPTGVITVKEARAWLANYLQLQKMYLVSSLRLDPFGELRKERGPAFGYLPIWQPRLVAQMGELYIGGWQVTSARLVMCT